MKNVGTAFLLLILPLLFGFYVSCGGESGSDAGSSDSLSESVNTEKLIGTPFEGLTLGDDLDAYAFTCGDYFTDSISSFPIPIFLAFFTEAEEEIIKEGIDVANNSMGFAAYKVTDTWTDQVRVIYKVEVVNTRNAAAHTSEVDVSFPGSVFYSGYASDWAITIRQIGILKGVIAHELGHASGIEYHELINYETGELSELEENSLMGTTGPYSADPAMTDYNYMMSMQGQIMTNYLGQVGEIDRESECE